MKSCFFIGHREATEALLPQLMDVIERLVSQGVTDFVVGHYGGFDRVAASAVQRAKARHPYITLTMLIPYHPAERPSPLPPGYDGSFYPPGMERVPRRLAILRANRYMVDHADVLVSYVWHPASNARALVEYAEKKGCIQIIRLSRCV